MVWALLLAAHLFGLVSYTLLLRKSAAGSTDKVLLAAMFQTCAFIPAIAFLIIGTVNFSHPSSGWLKIIASGFMLAGVHLWQIQALSKLDASFWTIIFNLRLFLITILGYIFLNELPPRLQIMGGLIIFASILMLNLHKNKKYTEAGVLIGLAATTWFSFHAVLEKSNIISSGFETYMFISGGISTAILWTAVLLRRTKMHNLIAFKHKQNLSLLATRTISAWAYVLAIKYGSLAVTNYISGLGVVIIVVLGVLLLNEKQYLRQKILATFTAVVGLTLILVSRL